MSEDAGIEPGAVSGLITAIATVHISSTFFPKVILFYFIIGWRLKIPMIRDGVSPIDSIIHRRDFKSRFSDIFGFAVVYSMEGSLFFTDVTLLEIYGIASTL